MDSGWDADVLGPVRSEMLTRHTNGDPKDNPGIPENITYVPGASVKRAAEIALAFL